MATILNREATIRTAVVEIKALTVSGKQVTLAVFRQLEEKGLLHPSTGELAGEPWGRVNYHVDCMPEKEHLHLVWQDGEELRRAVVYTADWRNETAISEIQAGARRHWVAALLQRIADEEPLIAGVPAAKRWADANAQTVVVPGLECRDVPASVLHRISYYWQCPEEPQSLERADLYKALVGSMLRLGLIDVDWEDLPPADHMERWREKCLEATESKARWAERYRELKALDQLFIAV